MTLLASFTNRHTEDIMFYNLLNLVELKIQMSVRAFEKSCTLLILNIKIMRKYIEDFSFMLNFAMKIMNVCNNRELKDITGICLSHCPYGSAFTYFH